MRLSTIIQSLCLGNESKLYSKVYEDVWIFLFTEVSFKQESAKSFLSALMSE